MKQEEKKLPEGLEEAAETIALPYEEINNTYEHSNIIEICKTLRLSSFKAGAKWRDAQIPKLPDNLEEAADKYAHSLGYDEEKDRLEIASAKEDFIAGAEYQRKQDQSLIELAEDHAILAGRIQMKEEMMETAVEGIVQDDGQFINFGDGRYIDLDPTMGLKPVFELTDGDKVKVIVIPEEK